ncbi:winged helix-turn-helix domain-containing protein [Nonomuraea roseola]|uniref:DNA glycosylase AlkZ-like family protein n=1 Tax=Nonomuraea roseola TaxID=46179 RepID=A0ABV5PQZ3_9ACTN
MTELSADDARRLILRAQGFLGADARRGGVEGMLRRLGAVQLDTISVLARSHELVAYGRLGAVGRETIERAYWHNPARSFEYWCHAACILPIEHWPLYDFRRRGYRARKQRWHEVPPDFEKVLHQVRDSGPVTTSDIGGAKKSAEWWDWSDSKIALEWLLDIGELVCTQRIGWRRVYDLAERAVPTDLLGVELTDEECIVRLARIAGAALGVATRADLIDFLRLKGPYAAMLDEALASGAAGLVPVHVAGWPEARPPRRTAVAPSPASSVTSPSPNPATRGAAELGAPGSLDLAGSEAADNGLTDLPTAGAADQGLSGPPALAISGAEHGVSGPPDLMDSGAEHGVSASADLSISGDGRGVSASADQVDSGAEGGLSGSPDLATAGTAMRGLAGSSSDSALPGADGLVVPGAPVISSPGSVRFAGIGGRAPNAWADPEALASVARGRHRTTLVSPFDSLIWHRGRTSRIFGFDYQLEIYVPKPKRVHGYFTMPVLAGGKLIGRVDPAREGSTFVARHVSFESSVVRPVEIAAVRDALWSAASWVGCTDVRVERVTSEAHTRPLLDALPLGPSDLR